MKGGYINLGFFRGTELPDSKGLLEGTGKVLRHVKVRHVDDIRAADLKTLVRAAIRKNEETR